MHCRQGVQEYHMHNAFGALTSLANLQAIAAMQGAANLSGAGGAAALGANLDFVGNMNRHAGLGGLGGLGLNSEPLPPAAFRPLSCLSPFYHCLPVTLLPPAFRPSLSPFCPSLPVTLLPYLPVAFLALPARQPSALSCQSPFPACYPFLHVTFCQSLCTASQGFCSRFSPDFDLSHYDGSLRDSARCFTSSLMMLQTSM